MAQPATLEEALGSLSDVQRCAVRHQDGALLVLAGPGSGKTRILTTRIARLLHEAEDAPFRVLALTFTNRAADEMRGRIERMAPEAEHRLFIGTFHAFSADVLRQHGQHLGIKTDFRIYSTTEDRAEIGSLAIASEAGRAAGLEAQHGSFLPLVDRAKAKLIPSKGVASRFRSAGRGAKFEAFYAAYDAALSKANALDFNSLVFNVYRLFVRFPALARRYRSVYRYCCIDEFQDTNLAQYETIKAMAGGELRNVFAVADDDQIIYQWNGADHRRLDEFREDFEAEIVQVPTNFRCPPEVVTCANRLIAHNLLRNPRKRPLVAERESTGSPSVVEVLSFGTAEDETQGIAEHIERYRGDALAQTAVLARVRRLLSPIGDALADRGIASQVVVRRDEFQSPAFRWLHSALRLAVHNTDERVFRVFCSAFNEMFTGTLSASEILAESEGRRVDLLTAWHRAVHDVMNLPAALSLADATARHHRGGVDHASFAAGVIGVFDQWLEEDRGDAGRAAVFSAIEDDRGAWRALSAEVGRAIGVPSDPERFLQELDLRSKEPPVGPSTVSLMTIHGAKGSEFDHVYVCGLAEGIVPSYHSKSAAELEEERRSCFVAVTRCQQSLTLSYARRYSGWRKAPSRFLGEMGLRP